MSLKAAEEDRLEVVKVLHSRECNLLLKDRFGRTAYRRGIYELLKKSPYFFAKFYALHDAYLH